MYPSSDAGMGNSTLPLMLIHLFLSWSFSFCPYLVIPKSGSLSFFPLHIPTIFPPSLPMLLSHLYLSLSQCCSWTEYGKTAAHVTHLHHSLRLHHPCRCLMRVQAQRTGQRWTRAWEAGMGRSIMVYLKNCPPFQSLHQAVLHLISIHTQQAASTLPNSPHSSKTHLWEKGQVKPCTKVRKAFHSNCLIRVEGWQKS